MKTRNLLNVQFEIDTSLEPAQAHEFVDVELVVGEQQEVLEIFRCGTGVVAQPVQRIIDPRRGKQ